ncbi:MAG: hypothetical protein LUH57_01505 [Ruminococcus sp.]|nr:hypothetical protein [Ruminococcus sp.]
MAKIGNVAYDYDSEQSLDLQPKPKIRHILNQKLKPKASTAIKYTITGTIAGLLLLAIVFGRVELSKIYSEQSDLQSELSELTEANASLKSELESKTGLSQVEEYAEQTLGLQKLDKSQVEYVEVDTDEVVESVKTEDNVFVAIEKWFNDVLEYIGA